MSERNRKPLLAALIVGVPLLFGIGLIALSDLARPEERSSTPPTGLREGPAPVKTGTGAPRIRLTDARTGHGFDSRAAAAPYGVLFASTRCEQVAGLLRRTASELRRQGSPALVLVISAAPGIDTRTHAHAWLVRHHEPPNLHFLVGDEAELRPYWSAWGFSPAAGGGEADCEGAVPIHLVTATGENAGVIDIEADSPGPKLAQALEGIPG